MPFIFLYSNMSNIIMNYLHSVNRWFAEYSLLTHLNYPVMNCLRYDNLYSLESTENGQQ